MTEQIEKQLCRLNASHVKWIALFFMTVDHFGAYAFEIPIVSEYRFYLRLFGRIAAPLFLFVLIESIKHTHNINRFIRRLYLAGLFTGLFQAFTNLFLGDVIGRFDSGNIFFTFFYIALYCYIIGKAKQQSGKATAAIKYIFYFIGITIIPIIVLVSIDILIPDFLNYNLRVFVNDLLVSFFPVSIAVEYGFGFILLGIVYYLLKSKWLQCGLFFAICCICYIRKYIYIDLWIFDMFLAPEQRFMVLALPFMALYSGNKGKSPKYFFYFYYPLHRYFISIITVLIVHVFYS